MPFQILSLSGGGYLGLYTVLVLEDLERQLGQPLASCFDLIAGTSIGGIIALGLAAERPAREIVESFDRLGTTIFSERAPPTTRIGRWREATRALFKPKYNGVALRDAVAQIVGDETLLGDLVHPVIITAVNLTNGRPQIFKTPHHPNFKRDHSIKVVDVAMATSAAPTYFPLAQVGDHLFADGGLYANSPDLMAIHEAEHFLNVPANDIRLLSVGTTTTLFSFPQSGGKRLGIMDWFERLPKVMIATQQASVDDMMRHKLAERYVRVDAIQSPEQMRELGLDVATEHARRTIRAMAATSVQRSSNDPMLEEMLAYRAHPPKFHYGAEKSNRRVP